MTITPTDLKGMSRTGEFDSLGDAVLQAALDEAACSVTGWTTCQCGDSSGYTQREYGNLLLAAHLLIDGADGGSGGVQAQATSMKLGPAAVSFAAGASDDSDPLRLSATTYGRRFSRFREMQPIIGLRAGF